MRIIQLFVSLLLVLSCSWETAAAAASASASASVDPQQGFIQCLLQKLPKSNISSTILTPNNSSFLHTLHSVSRNLWFRTSSTPKPIVMVAPFQESEVAAVIACCKTNKLQLRIRSGGHDYAGLSYVTDGQYVVLDMFNLRAVDVNAGEGTAWVQAGAQLGDVYYHVGTKGRNLGFPAGTCPTVGVGGHFAGGGEGMMTRKFGLAADNVLDARIMDVNGRIMSRITMGEDLFWAIRGGGGNSFGVVLAYKLNLADMPKIVTTFTPNRTLEQNMTQIVHRWQQVADKFHEDLFIRIHIQSTKAPDGHKTVMAAFHSFYLGTIDQLLPLMKQSFPELGLTREDCHEMTWLESVLYFAGFPRGTPFESLLNRVEDGVRFQKAKSDYVHRPIPIEGLQGLWNFFYEKESELSEVILTPSGGRMYNISDTSIAYPYRVGNIFQFQHATYWTEPGEAAFKRQDRWLKRLYKYLTPYVSKNPRSAYINYRDLDIGVNNKHGKTSYARARIWGVRYFKHNFDRLVRVKTRVDPGNFFRNEQSVPSLLA